MLRAPAGAGEQRPGVAPGIPPPYGFFLVLQPQVSHMVASTWGNRPS